MAAWPYNTKAWRDLRRAKLVEQPLCEACLRREIVEPADTVDHIVAIEKGGDAFPPLDQLMSMCTPCHNAKTNAVDHPNASGFRRALKGFDVEGNPIDPEGWEAPGGAARPDIGVTKAGAFATRAALGAGPAGESRRDLVLLHYNKREAGRWV